MVIFVFQYYVSSILEPQKATNVCIVFEAVRHANYNWLTVVSSYISLPDRVPFLRKLVCFIGQ